MRVQLNGHSTTRVISGFLLSDCPKAFYVILTLLPLLICLVSLAQNFHSCYHYYCSLSKTYFVTSAYSRGQQEIISQCDFICATVVLWYCHSISHPWAFLQFAIFGLACVTIVVIITVIHDIVVFTSCMCMTAANAVPGIIPCNILDQHPMCYLQHNL